MSVAKTLGRRPHSRLCRASRAFADCSHCIPDPHRAARTARLPCGLQAGAGRQLAPPVRAVLFRCGCGARRNSLRQGRSSALAQIAECRNVTLWTARDAQGGWGHSVLWQALVQEHEPLSRIALDSFRRSARRHERHFPRTCSSRRRRRLTGPTSGRSSKTAWKRPLRRR